MAFFDIGYFNFDMPLLQLPPLQNLESLEAVPLARSVRIATPTGASTPTPSIRVPTVVSTAPSTIREPLVIRETSPSADTPRVASVFSQATSSSTPRPQS